MFALLRLVRGHFGHDRYSAETIDRLLYSAHVQDLRWVANVTTITAILALGGEFLVHHWWPSFAVTNIVTAVAATFAVWGAVIAWSYQTGSARLGMVDLFACEITTLCRICQINGLMDSCIRAVAPPRAGSIELTAEAVAAARGRFRNFDSQEAYTPIFDGNAKELRNLSVKVVTNITAFYTYWKSMRDAFRKLAGTDCSEKAMGCCEADPWSRGMRSVIYMHFLACESARKSVRDLMEFEPNNAENAVTILLSELPAYRFLLDHFPEYDVRHARLALRKERYREMVPKLCRHVETAYGKYGDLKAAKRALPHFSDADLKQLGRDWEKSYRMLPELRERYAAAIEDGPRLSLSPAPVTAAA